MSLGDGFVDFLRVVYAQSYGINPKEVDKVLTEIPQIRSICSGDFLMSHKSVFLAPFTDSLTASREHLLYIALGIYGLRFNAIHFLLLWIWMLTFS